MLVNTQRMSVGSVTESKVEPAIQLTPEEMQAYKKSRRGIFTEQ